MCDSLTCVALPVTFWDVFHFILADCLTDRPADMLQRSYLRQNAAAAAKSACKPAKWSLLVPCASLQRDVSAGVASVTSAPTAESSTSTATQIRQEPYRVTDATIADIKSYHKSQIREYDYIVDGSWVSRHAASLPSGPRHTGDHTCHQGLPDSRLAVLLRTLLQASYGLVGLEA